MQDVKWVDVRLAPVGAPLVGADAVVAVASEDFAECSSFGWAHQLSGQIAVERILRGLSLKLIFGWTSCFIFWL